MWIHPRCLCQQAFVDKMLWTAAAIAAVLLLLSILHCPGEAHYEFLRYTLNAIRVFTLNIFFFLGALFLQMHQPYSGNLSRLSALQFPLREKAHCLRFSCIVSSLAMAWFHCLFLLSLPHCPEIIRAYLFFGTGLQIGYHGLESFGQSTI